MVEVKFVGDVLWARIERAAKKIEDRLRRTTTALNDAGVPYAVIGKNAVQYGVTQVDESVVRNTRDVKIILNRADLTLAIEALERAGFNNRHSMGTTMFVDGPDAKARDAIHVIFRVRKSARITQRPHQISATMN